MAARGTGSAWCVRCWRVKEFLLPGSSRWRLVPGAWGPGSWHPRAMDKALVPVRDLTDSDQNQAVLDVASALAEGGAAAGRAAGGHGPALAAEAIAAAPPRARLGEAS